MIVMLFFGKRRRPFSVTRDPELRNKEFLTVSGHSEDWIPGGSVVNWGTAITEKFDFIVFLHIPQPIRMERLQKRETERYGAAILADPARKEKSEVFLEWAKDYDEVTGIATRNIKAHREWLQHQQIPVLEINGDFSTAERIVLILNRLRLL
ncbi:adenylate kinase [Flavobacterium kingsejongi]|uniref:adenylate kinase n=1 Tax=Flavobacterium kingsejongi TaxID=1678728 RepID=UPI001D13157A|nr:adenylate kinase [Flavobacterium kingsejongi]